jgi:hypothetical protein
VLSIGLVPNRYYLNTGLCGKDARLKLRFGLMGKPVTHTYGKLGKLQLFTHCNTLFKLIGLTNSQPS